MKETCFELHGYPRWWDKGKKLSKPKTTNNVQHKEKNEGRNIVLIVGLMNEQYVLGYLHVYKILNKNNQIRKCTDYK